MAPKMLSQLRKEKQMSQRELANALGLKPSTIAMYELGLRTPPLETAKSIASFFNVRVEDIFFGEDARTMRASSGKPMVNGDTTDEASA